MSSVLGPAATPIKIPRGRIASRLPLPRNPASTGTMVIVLKDYRARMARSKPARSKPAHLRIADIDNLKLRQTVQAVKPCIRNFRAAEEQNLQVLQSANLT